MNFNQLGTLLLRITVGLTFFLHGLAKFQGGIENTVGFFESLGFPGVLAYVVAIIELVGGIMMILGIKTKIIGWLFVAVLAVAIIKVKLAAGFMGNDKTTGYEFDILLLAASLFFALGNDSIYSIEQKFMNK
ncbi:DoxX family protein [Macrococcus capreoli]|uniref:DoxX family protein n=1 Tax=Macrococcus capreoli TaxID=2982690 RepID=UPI0021D601F1|nr:DoxX family protein [Macrococcus sp. TMW 2.2395]MCU7556933.1 DoxX family protein [Macrococcus sp. TMW 2.2395]